MVRPVVAYDNFTFLQIHVAVNLISTVNILFFRVIPKSNAPWVY